MPKIDGGVISAAIAGGGSGNHIVLGGLVSGAGTSIAGVQFTRLDAALAGTMQQAPINLLDASGPWGTFRGRGEFSTQRFVAYGDYRGSFEGLAPFLGSAISGRGRLGGTVAIAVEANRIVVVGLESLDARRNIARSSDRPRECYAGGGRRPLANLLGARARGRR